ncbi:MAG: hypothetical protein IV100_08410 [Myxococcales bacterium]|nr:hypothetical protein [Myxococcales bacterium]
MSEIRAIATTGALCGRSTFATGRPIAVLESGGMLLVSGFSGLGRPEGEPMDVAELEILINQGGAFRFDTAQKLPAHPAVWIVRRGFSHPDLRRELHSWLVLERGESSVFLVDASAARPQRENVYTSSRRWAEAWLKKGDLEAAEREARQAEALGLEPTPEMSALRGRILMAKGDHDGLNELRGRAVLELGDGYADFDRLLRGE